MKDLQALITAIVIKLALNRELAQVNIKINESAMNEQDKTVLEDCKTLAQNKLNERLGRQDIRLELIVAPNLKNNFEVTYG